MKPGDIYQLGDHRLACGSSSDGKLLGRLISNQKIAAVVTDPPYGVDYVASKQAIVKLSASKNIENDNITKHSEYLIFTQAWLEAIRPHLQRKNSLYIFNSDKMLLPIVQALSDTGGKFAQLLIWVKNQPVLGRLDYIPQHELILYGWYGTHAFAKSKDKSVLVYPRPQKSKLHPTMKPVGLLRRLILNSTVISDIVFDGFGGSGSTLMACEQTKRQCLIVELDPEYCEIIIKRWEKLTGLKAEKLP